MTRVLLLFTPGAGGGAFTFQFRQSSGRPAGHRAKGCRALKGRKGLMIHQSPWHATLDSAHRRRMRCPQPSPAMAVLDNTCHRPATSQFAASLQLLLLCEGQRRTVVAKCIEMRQRQSSSEHRHVAGHRFNRIPRWISGSCPSCPS